MRKKAKPKKRFLEEAHCHRISDAFELDRIEAMGVLFEFCLRSVARETQNLPTHNFEFTKPLHHSNIFKYSLGHGRLTLATPPAQKILLPLFRIY